MSKQSRLRRAHKKKRPVRVPAMPNRSRDPMHRMVRNHQDILQNIEFVLVTSSRDDPTVDDAAADRALTCAMRGGAPDDPQVADILTGLQAIRQVRPETPDAIWQDGLLTVLQSVRRHSTRLPGERRYLQFVSRFII